MGTDLGIMLPENPEDPESAMVAGLPNEYLAESVDSATIIPEDPRNLDGLRDYLEEIVTARLASSEVIAWRW